MERRLTLLSRPGCGLCREMKALLERLRGEWPHQLHERNIAEDPALLKLYATEIPVLLHGGTEIARHRIGESELRRRLLALDAAGEPGGPTG